MISLSVWSVLLHFNSWQKQDVLSSSPYVLVYLPWDPNNLLSNLYTERFAGVLGGRSMKLRMSSDEVYIVCCLGICQFTLSIRQQINKLFNFASSHWVTHSLTPGCIRYQYTITWSAILGISRLLWNQIAHWCVYKSLPLIPNLSQKKPVHILPSVSLRPILILSSRLYLGRTSGFSPYRFPNKILYTFFISTMLAICLANTFLFDLSS